MRKSIRKTVKGYSRFLAGSTLLSLTVAACAPSGAPTVASKIQPSVLPVILPSSSSTQTPVAPVTPVAPLPPRAVRLSFKLDPALLGSFRIKQITDVAACQQALTSVQTVLTVPGTLSAQAQTNLSQAGIQIQDQGTQTLLTFSNTVQQLAADTLGLNYTLNDLPVGTTTGQTTFRDSQGAELGFVDYNIDVTAQAGTTVTVQLKSTGATSTTLPACPQVQAQLSGATLTSTGGDISAAPVASPTPAVAPPVIAALSTTTGAVLDPVVITGSGFTGATSVKFAGIEAFSFNVDSDTQITAQVPNGFSSGILTVSNPGGPAYSADTFTLQSYAGGPRTLYVNAAAAGGDGSSWASAMNRLDTAVYIAQAGDQVWVTEGVYLPTPTGDRNKSFLLQAGTTIYGGFVGTETDPSQRNLDLHETVLSGDLARNDDYSDANFSDMVENSYHIVIGANNVTLDGLTIAGGNADGVAPHDRGGGLYNKGTSPILNKVRFLEDRANYLGGGIYNSEGASPQLSNVAMNGCFARQAGGAIYNAPGSVPSVSNSTIAFNSAKHGGGVFNEGASPVFTNVSFTSNTAQYFGGGLCNRNGASPTLNQGRFENNRAAIGGGIYNVDASSPSITGFTFVNNKADNGAGLYAYNNSIINLQESVFKGNIATYYGGGIYLYKASAGIAQMNRLVLTDNTARNGGGIAIRSNSAPTLTNTMLSNNFASVTGGGIYVSSQAAPVIRHVTMYNNSANNTGSEIYADYVGRPSVISSIVWNPYKTKPINKSTDSQLSVSNSIVSDLSMATGSGNQLADPYFVNFLDMDGPDDVYLTSDDGMRLSDTSPALGAGLAAGMPAADILGVARTSPPDAGAYQGGFTSILPPLLVQDLVVGTGPAVATGNAVTVNYIGTLTNGTEFDNSYTRGQPFSFTVGANQVIKGWEQGLIGMQAGGKRRLTIPPHLAYGSATVGIIPPDSTLIFEIELVSIP